MRATFSDTAIVGAGLAGTVVAACLARSADPLYRVALFDPRPAGPGTSYACASDRLLMNGPVRAMSAMPANPHHLLEWLGGPCEDALIARKTFGNYLRELLESALRDRPDFKTVRSTVVDVEREAGQYLLLDSRGIQHRATNVVFALGNPAPDDSFLPKALLEYPGYVGDPGQFSADGLRGDAIALVGSGLTALDAVALLDERGYDGTIHLISRHGLLPALEDPLARGLDPGVLALDTRTPYSLLRTLRKAIASRAPFGGDWREVLESIRKTSPAIWVHWSDREKRRFLRHLQSFWAVHRYRVPAETAAALDRFVRRGQVLRHRGRVRSALPLASGLLSVEIASAQDRAAFDVSAIVNCTGPNVNYTRSNDLLIHNLQRRGLLRADRLHLGIDATPNLRLIDRAGRAQSHLFTLGAPLRGLFYETTAVPETRDQAAQIASELISMRAAMTLGAVS